MKKKLEEVDNHMYEACKSTWHEWTSKYEVESYKEYVVVELLMKKEIENKEILREKEKRLKK